MYYFMRNMSVGEESCWRGETESRRERARKLSKLEENYMRFGFTNFLLHSFHNCKISNRDVFEKFSKASKFSINFGFLNLNLNKILAQIPFSACWKQKFITFSLELVLSSYSPSLWSFYSQNLVRNGNGRYFACGRVIYSRLQTVTITTTFSAKLNFHSTLLRKIFFMILGSKWRNFWRIERNCVFKVKVFSSA